MAATAPWKPGNGEDGPNVPEFIARIFGTAIAILIIHLTGGC